MATTKLRLLDVWIVEINTVYREVPFAVVTDWLQQARLLADDCVRLAGSKKWHAIRAVPALTPYLPRLQPKAAQDRAEALEPVELDVEWRHPGEAEDEDVDMIPLIDISLVLLIFFMMTASVTFGIFSPIATPAAEHQLAAITKDSYWVGIDVRTRGGTVEKGPDGQPLPWFSSGKDNRELREPTLKLHEALAALTKELEALPAGEVKVRLRAERTLPIETVTEVTLSLQRLEESVNRTRGADKGKLTVVVLGEVSEPKK
jgi:biopolymer transport protein ExbD